MAVSWSPISPSAPSVRSDSDGDRIIARNIEKLVFSVGGPDNRYLSLNMKLRKNITGGPDSRRSLEVSFARRN